MRSMTGKNAKSHHLFFHSIYLVLLFHFGLRTAIKTQISNLVPTTRFWNNLHQVCSKPNNLKIIGLLFQKSLKIPNGYRKEKQGRQCNDQKNNDLKIEKHKLHTKDRGELRFSRRISSSCPICCSHCVSTVQICVRHQSKFHPSLR